MFEAAKNQLNNLKNGIISAVYAPPTESRFAEDGKLTPLEFVASGDSLISLCPQWKWMPASSDRYVNKYLPLDKQYLIMEKVACDQRIRDFNESVAVNEQEEEDEYVINEIKKPNQEGNENFIEQKIGGLSVKEHFNSNSTGQEEESKKDGDDDDNIVVVEAPIERRYYDLSIIYDLAYYTPHLYVCGVDEDNVPLKQEQLFEDIVSYYSTKTVTFETMPQTGVTQASLHPCKHADVFKHIVKNISEGGGVVRSHQCMFIFLKFLQSVIPTIQYDIASDVVFE